MSRERARTFLFCFPSVLISLLTLVVLAFSTKVESDLLAEKYKNVAADLGRDRAFLSARVFFEKSASLDPSNPIPRFEICRLMLLMGDAQNGMHCLHLLAPLGESEYKPAQELLARLAINNPNSTKQELKEAARRLALVIPRDKDADPLMADLARLYERLDEPSRAEEVLLRYSNALLPAKRLLVRHYHARKLYRKALKTNNDLVIEGLRKIGEEPGDHRLRMVVAEAILIQRKRQESEALLLDGYKHFPNAGNLLEAAVAGIYVELLTRTREQKGQMKEEDTELFLHGLDLSPRSEQLLKLGEGFLQLKGPAQNRLLKTLGAQLESGKISEIGLHLLALDAHNRKDTATAIRYWLKAVKQWPEFAMAHRNLALVYASLSPPDHDKALQHITIALVQFPQSVAFHQIRAELLEKNGNYPEAIEEYEKARKLNGGKGTFYDEKIVSLSQQLDGNLDVDRATSSSPDVAPLRDENPSEK